MNKYAIPRIFFKKYINQLLSKTFCFLIRLYQNYLDGSTITFQDLKEEKIFDNYKEMEEACAELIKNNIILYNRVYNKKKNHYKYYLEYLDENKTFEVIYNIKVRHKHRDITDKYIENFLSKFPERVRDKLSKVIEGVSAYYLKFRTTIKTKLIYDLLVPFFDVDEHIIIKVCNAYLNKYYGKTRIQYIHAILRNEKENGKKNSFKDESLEYFRKKKEEIRRRMANKS